MGPSALVVLRRWLARPKLLAVYALEPVRAEGRAATLSLAVSGRGVAQCGRVRVRFDATGTPDNRCTLHLPVEVGVRVTVLVRGALAVSDSCSVVVAPNAPRAAPPPVTASTWPLPSGASTGPRVPAAALPEPPAPPRAPGALSVPRVAVAAALSSLRLRRDRLSAPRDPS